MVSKLHGYDRAQFTGRQFNPAWPLGFDEDQFPVVNEEGDCFVLGFRAPVFSIFPILEGTGAGD